MAKRYVASLLGLALLGGCSGGGSVPSAISNTPKVAIPGAGASVAQRNATATFTVRIPAAAQLKNFRAKFISSHTASILVYDTVAGTALPTVFANVSSPGSTIKVIVPAKAGDNTFTIQLKDGPDGTGNTLATKTVTVTLVADTDNPIPVVLSGVIASLSWDASPPQALLVGTAASFSPVLQGKDASGELIIGPYDSSIALTIPGGTITGLGTILGTFAAGTTPISAAVDSSGNVWVTNIGSNDVTKLGPDGTNLGTFGVGANPHGIAVDGNGNVWVVNVGSGTVTKLKSDGTTQGTFTAGAASQYIAIDSTGNAWVSNQDGNNVTELGPDGTILGTFPVGSSPQGIGIDSHGNIWVANNQSNNVTELSPSGANLGSFPISTPVAIGLAIDGNDNIWVGNGGNNSVTVLNSAGTIIGTFSLDAYALAVDTHGTVWALDSGKVTVLGSDGSVAGTFLSGNGGSGAGVDRNNPVIWIPNYASDTVTKLSTGTPGSSSGLTLSTTSLPDSTTALTVNYDGAGSGKGQICASVTGVSGSACTSPTGSNTTANLEVTGRRSK